MDHALLCAGIHLPRGTSAFFYGRRHPDLPRFLLVRGLWLVFLELTVLRLAWTFNFDFAHYEMAGVIWVIGWSMILMAALVRLPLKAIAAIGLIIIVGHNAVMLPLVSHLPPSLGWLAKILYLGFFRGPISFGPDGPNLIVLYSLIPWSA